MHLNKTTSNTHERKSDRLIQSLLAMGTNGYFPLFDTQLVSRSFENSTPLSSSEREEGFEILNRLTLHRGIDRKKTVILCLKERDQGLIIKLFFELVEKKMQSSQGVIQ